jgi:hypothetical protein
MIENYIARHVGLLSCGFRDVYSVPCTHLRQHVGIDKWKKRRWALGPEKLGAFMAEKTFQRERYNAELAETLLVTIFWPIEGRELRFPCSAMPPVSMSQLPLYQLPIGIFQLFTNLGRSTVITSASTAFLSP